QRQAWEHAVFRDNLLLVGLPLDDAESDVDGKQIIKLFDAKTLNDVFSGAGGNPQSTQVAEVKRVQGTVTAFITTAPTAAEQGALRDELLKSLNEQSQHLGREITQLDREIALENQKRPDVHAALEKQRADKLAKQTKVNDTLQSLNANDEKATQTLNSIFRERRLARVLLPFASTSTEYEELVRSTQSSEDRDLGLLQAKLDNVFNAALTGKILSDEVLKNEAGASAGHALNTDERKLAVVRILYGLIGVVGDPAYPPPPAAGGLQRVLAVCGMVNTIRGVEAQTQLMRKMADDLNYAIQRYVSEFVVAQNRQLIQTQDLADELRRQKQFLNTQQDLVERQTTLLSGLKLEIDQPNPPSATQPLPLGLNQRIAGAKDEVKVNLDVQTRMEESLFAARKQLRDLGDLNRKLEQMIRELEEKAKNR
ncbi:MAG TPA: hypothetical protein VGG61_12165, partial [Gemmataceae bacterium]